MPKKKTDPEKDCLGNTPIEYPEAPKTIEEIKSKRRQAFAKAIGCLELLKIQGVQDHFEN